MKILKYSLFTLFIALVIAQFFTIDKTNPPVDLTRDFISVEAPPAAVSDIMKSACYDCHSNETHYPWYANVAPVSWWLKDHVEEGKRHLNFSLWDSYTDKRKKHKIEEMVEEVEEGEMPLTSYTLLHAHARLSDEDQKMLTDWLRSLKQTAKP